MSSDGGPAFPMPSGAEPRFNETTHYNEGMTLRDYFAAQAVGAIINSPRPMVYEGRKISGMSELARSAYLVADAMLEARKS